MNIPLSPGSRRSAFSLIELLIALIIVAVLAVFLYSAVQKASEKSRQGACMNNLHLLWTGANLYATDHHGFLPWAATSASIRWETQISPYLGNYKTYNRWDKVWAPSGPYTCPSTAKNWWLGYGWNYQGIGAGPVPANPDPSKPPASYTRGGPTRVGSKPMVVLIADSYYASNPAETVPENNNMLRPPTAAGAGKTPDVPHPHTGGLNTVFVDGHMEWCPAAEWYTRFKFSQ